MRSSTGDKIGDQMRKVAKLIYGAQGRWQARRAKKVKRVTYIFAGLLATIGLFLVNRHNMHTYNAYDVMGEVNLFPTDAKSKNYRVKVEWDISATPRGFYGEKRRYDVHYVTWPNGGTTEFPECELVPLEGKNTCEDIDFRLWKIEVHNDPVGDISSGNLRDLY